MVTATPTELNDIIDRVRNWEPASRALLARRILDTLDPSHIGNPPRMLSTESVFGLLKTDAPPPSGDEVQSFLEEERLRKHL